MRKPCFGNNKVKKGPRSKQEDLKLTGFIQKHREGGWRHISEATGMHVWGKSCRRRWMNYLRPEVKGRNFGEDEEDLIIKLHALLGNRWSLIAGRLPGRTDNEVKNHWNSHLKRKLVSMGIDPENHPPREPGNFEIIITNMPSASECKGFHHGKFGTRNVDLVSDAESGVPSDSSFLPS